MNKVFFLISLLLSSPLLSSISPPKFPDTFYTGFRYIFENTTTTVRYSGMIAEDNMNELMVILATYPTGFERTLFNQALYYITGDIDGNITECECYKNPYVPYFSAFKKFELFSQSKDEIIWQVTEFSSPLDLKVLFRVEKVTPNIPEENMIIANVPGYPPATGNMTYLAFHSARPSDEEFEIPDFCTKVPCKSTSYPKPDKFRFPNDWFNEYFH